MDDKWHTMIGVMASKKKSIFLFSNAMASKKKSTNMFDNVLKGVLFIYLLILKVFDFYFKMHFDISKGINYFF
jgi:hypothetical protein